MTWWPWRQGITWSAVLLRQREHSFAFAQVEGDRDVSYNEAALKVDRRGDGNLVQTPSGRSEITVKFQSTVAENFQSWDKFLDAYYEPIRTALDLIPFSARGGPTTSRKASS